MKYRGLNFHRLLAAALLRPRRRIGFNDRARIIGSFCPAGDTSPGKIADLLIAEFPEIGRAFTTIAIDRAAVQAGQWQDCGIHVINTENGTAFARGALELIDRPGAAVLNSRKPRRTAPEAEWVQVTAEMVRQAVRKGLAAWASLGPNHWELPAYQAARLRAPLILVLDNIAPWMDRPDRLETFLSEYGPLVDRENTLTLSPFPPGPLPPVRERGPIRDQWIARCTGNLFAAAIRPGGNMSGLIEEAHNRGAQIEVYTDDGDPKAVNLSLIDLGMAAWKAPGSIPTKPPAVHTTRKYESTAPPQGPFLYHYTRACPGPWPGQSRAEHYETLMDQRPEAGHTAFDTLVRILDQGLLMASNRLVRSKQPVVSLTALDPERIDDIAKWRQTLARWTVEPYGLAINKKTLFRLGARPAIYGDEKTWRQLRPQQQFRFQLHHPNQTNWRPEREWRLPHNLNLPTLPPNQITAITKTQKEAQTITQQFNLPAISVE